MSHHVMKSSLIIFLLILNCFAFSQNEAKKLVTINYLSYSDSLYEKGDYFFKNDTTFFGVYTNYTCGVYYKNLYSYNVYSYGSIVAHYNVEKKRIKLYYDTGIYTVKLGKRDFKTFLMENTSNGYLKPLNELNKKYKTIIVW